MTAARQPMAAGGLKGRRLLLATVLASLACMGAQAEPAAVRARPPNVIVILADDAGYADFGFQGSREFLTPRLDALARESVTYTAAYATTPFCSPSRAGLLTGRYPQRFGYEFNLTHAPPPGVDVRYMGLAVEEATIGARLKAAGYTTIAVGKWHVGSQAQFHPNRRGFDQFYGFLGGTSGYLPAGLKPDAIQRNGLPERPDGYLTDAFAREAVRYIERHRDEPFFLYLAFNAVHTPMDALAADVERFPGIDDPQRRRLAAMTWALDRAVGEVLDALTRFDLDDRTLVLFTNDNGGDRVGLDASNAPLRGTKGTLLEGGIRVPFLLRRPDRSGAGTRVDRLVSLLDILPTSLDIAGVPAPDGLDGVSLLTDAIPASQRPLFWRYDNMAAMRSGRWKLLRYPDRAPELYDLSTDVGERRNVAAREPARVRRMLGELFQWEAGLQHPRWNTGTWWSQEDVRRYDDGYVEDQIRRGKDGLAANP